MKREGKFSDNPEIIFSMPDEIKSNSLDDETIDRLIANEALNMADRGSKVDKCTNGVCKKTIDRSFTVSTTEPISTPTMITNENLHKDHRAKVRKRFLAEGLDNFQKHNVLELLLFYAIPRVDTNEIAHRLLNAYHGNLSEVLGADVKSLMKIDGVGESAAILLSMLPQVFRMYREELITREGIFGRSMIEQYIANRFTSEPVEKVLIACLDNRWNLLGDEFVSSGSVNFSSVDRRAIIEMCLRHNATAAIIAHNHPRGTALPSRDDLNTTIDVRNALEVIGVRLIDHLIVAREDYISLACSKNYNSLFI